MSQVTMVLEGVAGFVKAAKMTNEYTRNEVRGVIRRGTEAVVRGARSRVHKHTGELAFTIRGEYTKDGMTGFAKAGFGTLPRRSHAKQGSEKVKRFLERRKVKAEERRLQARLAHTSKQALANTDLGVYAPVVERGDKRRHHLAHPFLVPSLQAETPEISRGLAEAPAKGAKSGGLV